MPNLGVSFFVFMLQLKFINENLGFFSPATFSTIAYFYLNLIFHQLKIALGTWKNILSR